VLFRERNDLAAATRHLLASKELGEHAGFSQNPHRWRAAMARVREAEGDLAAAVELLDDAERLYNGDFSPDVRPIAALRARVRLAQGDIGGALAWARERSLAVDEDLSYGREFEHVTLCRVLITRHLTDRHAPYLHDAARLLERLLAAAEEGERMGSLVEILVLMAVAHQAQGEATAAVGSLERALALAEPEGYVRTFLDEGAPMATLLHAVAQRGAARAYARHLLASAGEALGGAPAQGGLVEPLSGRELTVLRLLRTDLSGPDIARELMVSLNTMRTHTKNIYTKLGVGDRRAAVRRAEELGL
jgi:LuxR family maltose regulon positive regulatory protein